MKTKIDVIIPTYNSATFLVDAVKSVLKQTYKVNKIIIVDDGSTDGTAKICMKLKIRYPQISYLRQNNSGLSAARNTGIQFSKAEYLAFCDADDVWEKEKLAKQVEVIVKSRLPRLGLVYCDYYNINEEGNRITYPSMDLDIKIRGNVGNLLMEGNYIASSGSGVLVKSECFTKVGMFDEKLVSCEDWDMWIRITQKYQVDYVNEKLVGIRRTQKSMSQDGTRMCIGMSMLYKKHGNMKKSKIANNYFFRVLAKQVINEYPHVIIVNKVRKIIGEMNVYSSTQFVASLALAIGEEWISSLIHWSRQRIK